MESTSNQVIEAARQFIQRHDELRNASEDGTLSATQAANLSRAYGLLSHAIEDHDRKQKPQKPIGQLTDDDLRYSAYLRCECGAGMAYRKDADLKDQKQSRWECSDILTGRAIKKGQPGTKTHLDPLPFAFYEVKSEDEYGAHGHTTRPQPASHCPGSLHDTQEELASHAHALPEPLSAFIDKAQTHNEGSGI